MYLKDGEYMRLTDIHCHLLPKVDDGAKSEEEALKLLEMEYAQGVRRIIVTPHYRIEMFETDQERIEQQYRWLKATAEQLHDDLEIYLGCEYHANSGILEDLKTHRREALAGSRYVLVEFSGMDSFAKQRKQIRELTGAGYIPVIAHAERYECLRNDIKNIEELIFFGAKIQVNADSVLGEEGRKTKAFCKKLMKQDLVDFIASDAHCMKGRAPNLGRCAEYVEKKMGHEYARRIFVENPSEIFNRE